MPKSRLHMFQVALLGQAAITMACASRELSRSTALDLISKSPELSTTASTAIIAGKYALVPDLSQTCPRYETSDQMAGIRCRYRPDSSIAADESRQLNAVLQSLGLIVIKENPPVATASGRGELGPSLRGVYLTAKGQSEGQKESENSYRGLSQWKFKTTSGREVKAITGITKEGEGLATAGFTWTWRPNETGAALIKAGLSLDGRRAQGGTGPEPRVGEGVARFKLYDDGWRLEAVSF